MSRVYDFDIQFGKIFLEQGDGRLAGSYALTWELLTSVDLAYEEWVVAFNVLGPALAREVKAVAPTAPARMIREYIQTVGESDPEVAYLLALDDENSQFTQVLRARFEVILKAARAAGQGSEALIRKHLAELRQVFPRIPKYCINAVAETLMLYKAR